MKTESKDRNQVLKKGEQEEVCFSSRGKLILKPEGTKQGKLGMIICITKGVFVSPKDSQQDFFK